LAPHRIRSISSLDSWSGCRPRGIATMESGTFPDNRAASLLAGPPPGLVSIQHQDNWRVFLLQVALGPVLEEVLFRGYLMTLLLWVLRVRKSQSRVATAAVLISAVAFGTIHLLRPGTTWKEAAVISGVGAIYGSIRMASGSSATAAIAHALYNVTLHVGMAASV
jgi:membrane protease YdiL (CAAX protease family)